MNIEASRSGLLVVIGASSGIGAGIFAMAGTNREIAIDAELKVLENKRFFVPGKREINNSLLPVGVYAHNTERATRVVQYVKDQGGVGEMLQRDIRDENQRQLLVGEVASISTKQRVPLKALILNTSVSPGKPEDRGVSKEDYVDLLRKFAPHLDKTKVILMQSSVGYFGSGGQLTAYDAVGGLKKEAELAIFEEIDRLAGEGIFAIGAIVIAGVVPGSPNMIYFRYVSGKNYESNLAAYNAVSERHGVTREVSVATVAGKVIELANDRNLRHRTAVLI